MATPRNNNNNKSYEVRKKTLKKKSSELARLCDVPVCLLCVNPDGTTETWPEEEDKVLDILKAYKDHSKQKKMKKNVDVPRVFETWEARFEELPEECLMDVLRVLDRQLEVVNREINGDEEREVVVEVEEKESNTNSGDGDGDGDVRLVTRNFIDLVGLYQTESCTSSHGISANRSSFGIPLDLELRLGCGC